MRGRSALGVVTGLAVMVLAGCNGGGPRPATASPPPTIPVISAPAGETTAPSVTATAAPAAPAPFDGLPGMPAPVDPRNVYAADAPNMLSPAVANDPAYVYVPNSSSNTVSVIDQHTMKVIATFPGGNEPQHVVPSWDLKTLYVTADTPGSGSLIPIDPATGTPGPKINIDDVYNMYFTPDGMYAIAVQEAYTQLAFYDPHTWKLHDTLKIPSCAGIDHMDFSADGRQLLATCEFANRMVVVDVATHQLTRTIDLHQVPNGKPQDVKLSPDGSVFYVADMIANGVYIIDATTFQVTGFAPTGNGAHGLYVARDSRRLVITNRGEGSVSVLDLTTGQLITKWVMPDGGSPDMGNISADGTVLWLSGRSDSVVYAISTVDGHLIAKIPVGAAPHGLTVWPLPGRYSLGHTGILR
jgi:YVTN family beta-propeller protein